MTIKSFIHLPEVKIFFYLVLKSVNVFLYFANGLVVDAEAKAGVRQYLSSIQHTWAAEK